MNQKTVKTRWNKSWNASLRMKVQIIHSVLFCSIYYCTAFKWFPWMKLLLFLCYSQYGGFQRDAGWPKCLRTSRSTVWSLFLWLFKYVFCLINTRETPIHKHVLLGLHICCLIWHKLRLFTIFQFVCKYFFFFVIYWSRM